MKIAYFPKQTALQSENVWKAFLSGMQTLGWTPVADTMDADAAVIWSVLWKGRLRLNKAVYDHYRANNKPVFIIEVGSLVRGVTWKVAINNITADGIYPLTVIDPDRASKLGISLAPQSSTRRSAILIATQHQESLQWHGMPVVSQWIDDTICAIRQHSDRQIIVRPHPRCLIQPSNHTSVTVQQPIKLEHTYDRYNIDFNYHCVINYCSGPSIQSPIAGTPVICSKSSLAFPVSMPLDKIESPFLVDRQHWFIRLCHTEWTIEEINQGIPQQNLISSLTF